MMQQNYRDISQFMNCPLPYPDSCGKSLRIHITFIPSILSILSNRLHEFAKPSDTKRKNKTKQKKEQISETQGFFGDHLPGSVWTDTVQKYPNSDSSGKSLRMHTTFILIILSRGIVIQILAHFTQRANCTKQKSNIS